MPFRGSPIRLRAMGDSVVRNLELPMLYTRAALDPQTVNEEARTIEAVWTTGARVLRKSWFHDPYFEELDVRKAKLGRLNNGAPILDSHNGYSVRSQLGRVERAWIDKSGHGRALLRFSKRAEVDGVWGDVRDGIVTHVSPGYVVHRYKNITEDTDEHKVLRAIDWEPYEISMVPMGADDEATTRGNDAAQRHPCIIESMEAQMGDNNQSTDTPETPAAADTPESPSRTRSHNVEPPVDLERVRREAAEAERVRIDQIRAAAHILQLPADYAQQLIERGVTLEDARGLMFEKKAREQPRIPVSVRAEGGDQDEILTRRTAMCEYLLHRSFPGTYKLEGAAVEYRGCGLFDLARECVEAVGVRVRGLSRLEIVTRALHSTSDFPLILENIASKSLRDSYDHAPATFRPLGRQSTLPDFKDISRAQLGEASKLLKIPEGGEFKYGTIGEAAEKYRLFTYGRALALSREAIINDDLGAFTRIPQVLGRAAADLESDLVWAHLIGNPQMSDAENLFSAAHGNLAGTPAVISVTSLGKMREAMRKQKGLDGETLINVMARYLVVPVALETVAEQFLATNMLPGKADRVNPFAGRFELVPEPRLDADSVTAWYGWADPAQIDTFEYAYLEGESGPYIESREHFDVNGMAIKVRHDFGVKAIDWRGVYKNAGV